MIPLLKRFHQNQKLAKLTNLANYTTTFLFHQVGSWPKLLPEERLRSYKKVLFLAPHQDDEAFSLGGTISLWDSFQTTQVAFVWFSRGEEPTRSEEARQFMAALDCSKGNLGVDPFPFADESVPVERSREKIREMISSVHPDLFCVPSIFDAHMDHLRLNVALRKAIRDTKWEGDVMQYEVWNTLPPTHSVDISTVTEKKRALMETFQSQLNEADRAYIERMRSLNHYRGMPFQIEAAEGVILTNAAEFLRFANKAAENQSAG